MAATGRGYQPTRERLALHTAVGLTVTALGVVGYQVTAALSGGSPSAVALGVGLLSIATTAGYTRRLWAVGAGFLVAIPLMLLLALGLLLPAEDPPPAWAVDARWLSILVMVAGIAIAMFALSFHVAVRLFDEAPPLR